jgi:hypothetical protein
LHGSRRLLHGSLEGLSLGVTSAINEKEKIDEEAQNHFSREW